MQPKKFRILSAITAGSLALAVAAVMASSGTGHTATHPALAAQTESFQPVDLDKCPTLWTGYPTGGCVAQLQTDLRIIQDPNLVVDGTFGPVRSQTWNAVTAFQTAHGLDPDGMVGPATKKALEAAISVPIPTTPAPPASAPAPPASAPAPPASAPAPPASAPAPPASAPAAEHCGTAEDTMNIMDPKLLGVPGPGAGSVHLSVDWCWDGSKITRPAGTPVVSATKTGNGRLLEWNIDTPVTNDKDPQDGGYWTRETVVTGTYQFCAVGYCLPTQTFKLDLYVFGDGVKYIANPANVRARAL